MMALESKRVKCHVLNTFPFMKLLLSELFLKCSVESIKLTFSAKEDKLEVSNDL